MTPCPTAREAGRRNDATLDGTRSGTGSGTSSEATKQAEVCGMNAQGAGGAMMMSPNDVIVNCKD